jgi:hypothetical protein
MENARMVAKRAKFGIPPRPDVRRSMALFPPSMVSRIGALAPPMSKSSRATHLLSASADTGSAHRRMHLEIARIQRPPLHAMQIRTALGRHHTPNHVAIDLGNTRRH